MTLIPRRCFAALSSLVVVVAVAIPATPAASSSVRPAGAQKVISEYLSAHPGGVVINDNEISYDGGRFIVTLTRPAHTRAAVADCPLGWFCFYDRTGYGYPRGRLSDCGRQNLATWGWQLRVESAHYNLSSGSVAFLYSGSRLFSVGAAARALGDVAPYRNWATHVDRYC
ncbi:hypothetical protein ACFP2T_13180 [Plantactinospora solaniradicis]|uniref:Peptidase inhibitor family I36 n=1 Tax=Plantactinospora solaniradicis TaxID=1723736 RepID=A0ABW1K809_9ACTN